MAAAWRLQMKKRLIASVLLIYCAFMIFTAPAGASSEVLSWYCVRAKNHMQPRCDSNMRFIEDYGGWYIDKNHGDACSSRVVYLTFDAGYENGNVERILDTLKEKQVRAAFFILSNLVMKNTDLVKRMSAEGHTVCNHTSTHKDMTKFHTENEFAAELKKLECVYRDCTGLDISPYYRPPEGKFSEENMKFANRLGYKTIFWSFAYADWDNNKQPDAEYAFNLIMKNIHNGAVILLHPTSKTNADILGRVIDALKNDGYSFGTLDELTAGKR